MCIYKQEYREINLSGQRDKDISVWKKDVYAEEKYVKEELFDFVRMSLWKEM